MAGQGEVRIPIREEVNWRLTIEYTLYFDYVAHPLERAERNIKLSMQAERESQAEAWGYNSGQFLDDLVTGKKDATKENLAVARFASAMLGHRIRLASITANQERDLFRFASKLAGDAGDLARYMRAALPTSGYVKMLDAAPPKEA